MEKYLYRIYKRAKKQIFFVLSDIDERTVKSNEVQQQRKIVVLRESISKYLLWKINF